MLSKNMLAWVAAAALMFNFSVLPAEAGMLEPVEPTLIEAENISYGILSWPFKVVGKAAGTVVDKTAGV